MTLLGIIFLLALGVAMIIKPYFFWCLHEFKTTKGGEPTKLYLWSVRISGIVLCGIVIGIIIAWLYQ